MQYLWTLKWQKHIVIISSHIKELCLWEKILEDGRRMSNQDVPISVALVTDQEEYTYEDHVMYFSW
jgi:hypothetical protein